MQPQLVNCGTAADLNADCISRRSFATIKPQLAIEVTLDGQCPPRQPTHALRIPPQRGATCAQARRRTGLRHDQPDFQVVHRNHRLGAGPRPLFRRSIDLHRICGSGADLIINAPPPRPARHTGSVKDCSA
eukprot:scaffold156241_cov32-Tisochrysis_lutea.AAC.2